VERQNRAAHHLSGFCRGGRAKRVAQTTNGSRVQLRHARFVDANLGANLLHRGFGVIVEADDLLLPRRQRCNGVADALADFLALVRGVRLFGLGRNEHRGQRGLVEIVGIGQRGGRLDRVDPNDGASELLLVRSHLRGEVCQRRFAAELATERFARTLELATLPAHPTRPGVLPQCVNHRAPDAALGEGLELDAARLVEPVRRVDQPDHSVLHQVADVDGVRHRGRDTAGKLLDERKAGDYAGVLGGELREHE